MGLVDFDLFKKHVRADDFTDDDVYLESILEAAECAVINAVNRPVTELLDMAGGELPPAIRQAILLVGGHFYNQRENVSTMAMHEVPLGATALITPFIKLTPCKREG